MSITAQFMDEIRARVNVSEIIGKSIKVTRAGREFKACCPFHNEKTPSFTINDQKGFYHCFGCGAHGDVIGFVMQYNNFSFMEAVEQLAAQAGLEVPQATPQEREKSERQKTYYEILDICSKWFEEQLFAPENNFVLEYLKKRGLSDEIIRAFRLGFAPEDRDLFVTAMQSKKIPMNVLSELGMTRPYKNKDGAYSFFRGRVMFPVADRRGRVVAFGGRILPQYDKPDGNFTPPKYLNSSDHPLFQKGQLLYNYTKARQAGANEKPIIVTEGYMDVIALAQAGIEGAVAPLGTAMTEEQIELSWKISPFDEKRPYLCFDGDNAGKKAAYRALERILPNLSSDKSVRFIFMPEGEDPDSLVKAKGSKGFYEVMERAMPLHEALWQKETEGRMITTPEDKAGLKARLDALIATIQDKTVQGFYFKEMNNLIYKNYSWSGARKDSYNKQNTKKITVTRKVETPLSEKQRVRAHILLGCTLNHPELFYEEEEVLSRLLIDKEDVFHLRNDLLLILADLTEEDDVTREILFERLSEKGHEVCIKQLLSLSLYNIAPFVKEECDVNQVREGWKDVLDRMQKDQELEDRKQAALAAARGGFEEKELVRLHSIGQLVLEQNRIED